MKRNQVIRISSALVGVIWKAFRDGWEKKRGKAKGEMVMRIIRTWR
jgi:hypothetical protein